MSNLTSNLVTPAKMTVNSVYVGRENNYDLRAVAFTLLAISEVEYDMADGSEFVALDVMIGAGKVTGIIVPTDAEFTYCGEAK